MVRFSLEFATVFIVVKYECLSHAVKDYLLITYLLTLIYAGFCWLAVIGMDCVSLYCAVLNLIGVEISFQRANWFLMLILVCFFVCEYGALFIGLNSNSPVRLGFLGLTKYHIYTFKLTNHTPC